MIIDEGRGSPKMKGINRRASQASDNSSVLTEGSVGQMVKHCSWFALLILGTLGRGINPSRKLEADDLRRLAGCSVMGVRGARWRLCDINRRRIPRRAGQTRFRELDGGAHAGVGGPTTGAVARIQEHPR